MNVEEVIDDIVTRIKGQTDAGDRVFASRFNPQTEDDLPSIAVFLTGQSATSLNDLNPAFRRTLNVELDILADGEDQADTATKISEQVKTALFTDAAWLDQFVEVNGWTESTGIMREGRKPTVGLALVINITGLVKYTKA